MCTVIVSNFAIAGNLLGEKFLVEPRWEANVPRYRQRQKNNLAFHYIVCFPRFTMHLISRCSLFRLHVSTTSFSIFQLGLLGDGKGKGGCVKTFRRLLIHEGRYIRAL